jgi:hypothetical protein
LRVNRAAADRKPLTAVQHGDVRRLLRAWTVWQNRALQVCKRLVEKPVAEAHARNENVFSDAVGPLDTYYPLIPVTEEERKAAGSVRAGAAGPEQTVSAAGPRREPGR